MSSRIKNIVFDIGNVLVRWAPHEAIQFIFPEQDPECFFQQLRPIWLELNLGKLSEEQAVNLYHTQLNLPKDKLIDLMLKFKTLQTPIPGSLELLQKLQTLDFSLYSITDNVKEIMDYHHRERSAFLPFFKGIISSADVGILKPDRKIFQYILNKYELVAAESIFIDDLIKNVEGARAVGMKAILFTDIESCKKELIKLGVQV